MKTRLLLILILFSSYSIGQDSLLTEEARNNIRNFNDSITKLIEKYEADEIDFIAIRSNVNHGPNCRFIVREDSCSITFILYLDEANSVGHIYCANIASRTPNDGKIHCEKNLDRMYFSLTDWENYFTKSKPDYSIYNSTKITFFGSINGQYMYESVDLDYFSTHHPGMFYDTFNLYY